MSVFRLLRFFWQADTTARPLLALPCAQARDPLLRLSSRLVLGARPGDPVASGDFARFFSQHLPGRFSPVTTQSLARNLAASWTQAGFLRGRVRKVRTRPVVRPAAAAYALVLGYLCGLDGQVLLDSHWARLLDAPRAELIRLAHQGAQRGWLGFKITGNVVAVDFRPLLTPLELKRAHGSD